MILKAFVVVVSVCGVVLFAVGLKNQHFDEQAKREATRFEQDAEVVQNVEAANRRWVATYDATGALPDGLDIESHSRLLGSVLRISPDSPSYTQARMLYEQLSPRQTKLTEPGRRAAAEQDLAERKQRAAREAEESKERAAREAAELKVRRARIANDAEGRRKFAQNLSATFLEDGDDILVLTSGPKDTVLAIRDVLMNRPRAYKITKNQQFMQRIWDAGFKKVFLADRINTYWIVDAPDQ